MKLTILFSVLGVLFLFLAYVSTKESKFNYSVTRTINAPAEKVFPYISDLKKGGEWNPFELKDPNMKKEYVGNKLNFEGNSEAGSGTLEVLSTVPNESAHIKLYMTKPMKVENDIEYRLVPVANGVDMTWSMYGDGGFMNKLMCTFIDCEKMIKGEFEKGFVNLKAIVEK